MIARKIELDRSRNMLPDKVGPKWRGYEDLILLTYMISQLHEKCGLTLEQKIVVDNMAYFTVGMLENLFGVSSDDYLKDFTTISGILATYK